MEQNIWPISSSDPSNMSDVFFASDNSYQFTEHYEHEPISLFLWQKKSGRINEFFYSGLFNHKTFRWTSEFQEYNGILVRTHDNVHLIYVTEGQVKSQIGNKDVYLTKGDMLLINGDVPHREILPDDDCLLILLDINILFCNASTADDPEDFKSLLQDWVNSKRSQYMYAHMTPIVKNPTAPSYFLNILREMYNNNPGRNEFILGSTKRILGLCNKEYHLLISSNNTSAFRNALVTDIENYIVSSYPTVTVKEIGAVFHYSPDYLGRIFLNTRGMTISAFIQDIRIKSAYKLLRTTHMPINAISEAVGYRNQGFFYQKFKEKYHMTPNEARKF